MHHQQPCGASKMGVTKDFRSLCEFFEREGAQVSGAVAVGPLAAATRAGNATATFFYDLPETVPFLAWREPSGELADHLCFVTDAPGEVPVAVVRNSGKSCEFSYVCDLPFPAVMAFVKNKSDPDDPGASRFLQSALEYCRKHEIDVEAQTSQWRARKKRVVAADLAKLGVVVPCTSTGVGYRPPPMNERDFLEMCDGIRHGNADGRAELARLVNWSTQAVDEGDFGSSLLLGRNLHCADSPGAEVCFRKLSRKLMKIAYRMLGRREFSKLLDMHVGTT